jgi:hypothetical protein
MNLLGAWAGGLLTGFWTFLIAFTLVFAIQRIFATEDNTNKLSDEL